MADTIRTKIFNAVADRFKTILIANGYETNLGQKIYCWKATPFDESQVPGMNLMDPKQDTQQAMAGVHEHTLHVEARVAVLTESPAAFVRSMIADITKAIGVDRNWTVAAVRLATDTDPVGDQMDTEHEGKSTGGACVKFKIRFRTSSFDPYTHR